MTSTTTPSPSDAQPVWFITGCSTGFGRALATDVLARGYRAVITSRNADDIDDFGAEPQALLLSLDVTAPKQVAAAVAAADARFGRIDVLVNNAGIGYFAAVEEGEDDQIRRLFEINVFGLAAMTRAVPPGMRLRGTGAIINLSSIGGLTSFPALGYYNATKFAVEGLSEALWQEVEPLGLKVMLVEPSGFRTDWAGRSADESLITIADYAATSGRARTGLRAVSGQQAGDPARAAQAIVEAIESAHPPHRLLLGNAAFAAATAKLDQLQAEFAAWEAVTIPRTRIVPTSAASADPPGPPATSPSALGGHSWMPTCACRTDAATRTQSENPAMNTIRIILSTLVATAVIAAVGGVAFIKSGIYDVSASTPDGPLVAWAVHATSEASVAARLGIIKVPHGLDAPETIAAGGRLFAQNCVVCHGAPGAAATPIAQGLNPVPPNLLAATRRPEEAENFQFIKYGVKMTAMPGFGKTHTDEQVWQL
eukprot:gene21217-22028_t